MLWLIALTPPHDALQDFEAVFDLQAASHELGHEDAVLALRDGFLLLGPVPGLLNRVVIFGRIERRVRAQDGDLAGHALLVAVVHAVVVQREHEGLAVGAFRDQMDLAEMLFEGGAQRFTIELWRGGVERLELPHVGLPAGSCLVLLIGHGGLSSAWMATG